MPEDSLEPGARDRMLSLVIPKVLCVRRADAAEVACTPTSKAVSVAISRRKKTKGRQPSAEHESESPIVHYRQWESTVLAISKYPAFHEACFITSRQAFIHAQAISKAKAFCRTRLQLVNM